MTCKPVTLASRHATDIVERGASPNLDMFDLVNSQNNPADAYDKEEIVKASRALNNALKNSDTSSYPLLTSRKNQSPILFPEVADFLTDSGLNLDNVNQTLSEYEDFIEGTTGTSSSAPNTSNTQDNRVPPYNIPSDVDKVFSQLEFYYSENMANSISGGLCAAIANPFGKLLGALEALNFAGDLLDKLLDFSLADLLGPLDALKANLEKMVDSLKKTLEAQVDGLVNSAKSAINNIKSGAEKIIAKVKKMVKNVKAFFNSDGSLKEKIGDLVAKASEQFKELTPSTIALMMFRFCQFTEMMQAFMKGPVDGLKSFVTGIAATEQVVSKVSDIRKKEAVNAGAVRLSDDGIKKAKERIVKSANAPAKERDSKPLPEVAQPEEYTNKINEEEMTSSLLAMSDSGIDGKVKFADSVKNMGKGVSDADDNAGWENISDKVYARLIEISNRMEKVLTINSGYRSPKYNAKVGGAKESLHMSGLAVDISTSGFSDDDVKNLIRIASQEGFLGIAVYDSFVHLDLGSRRSWNRDKFDDYIAIHLQDGFRKGEVSSVAKVEEPLPEKKEKKIPDGTYIDPVTGLVKTTDGDKFVGAVGREPEETLLARKRAYDTGVPQSYNVTDNITGKTFVETFNPTTGMRTRVPA